MSTQIAFVLGAGPHIGHHTTLALNAKGFRVALVARSLTDGTNEEGSLQIRLDLAEPTQLPQAFSKVKEDFGSPPSVVLYNGKPCPVHGCFHRCSKKCLRILA